MNSDKGEESASDKKNSTDDRSDVKTDIEDQNNTDSNEEKLITVPADLTFEGKDYTITAHVDADAKLPAGTKLDVTEITEDDERYQAYHDSALEEIKKENADTETLSSARFFDITFKDSDNDDAQAEPSADVKITVKYNDAIKLTDGGMAAVVHFDDTTEDPEVLDTDKYSVDTHVKDGKTDTVEFKNNAFSVYGIIATEKKESDETNGTLTAQSDGYKITISYSEDAGIPEGASIDVSEITGDDAASYANKASEKLGTEVTASRFFNIHILDKDGNRIQPNSAVRIKITYDEPLTVGEGQSIQQVHFKDSNTSEESTAAAKKNVLWTDEENDATADTENEVDTEESSDDSIEVLDVATEGNTAVTSVEFEQSSFSVTGTVVSNNSNNWPSNGTYVMVLSYGGKYYAVSYTRSLKEVTYSDGKVTFADATSTSDIADYQWTLNGSGSKRTIKSANYSTYIDPGEDKGTKSKSESMYRNSTGYISGKDDFDKEFLGVNDSSNPPTLAGDLKSSSSKRAQFYFANNFSADSSDTPVTTTGFTVTYNGNSYTRIHVVDSSGNEIGTAKTYFATSDSTDLSVLAAQANPDSSQWSFVRASIDSYNSGTNVNSNGWLNYSSSNVWRFYNSTTSNDYYTVTNRDVYFVYQRTDGNVTVTFNANGGNSTPDPQTITGKADSIITLPNYTGTRSGYTFMGWSTATSLLSDTYHDVYPAGSTYTMPDSDTTLYAAWSNNNYTNTTAHFYVRLDGTIPAEPGSFASANYTSGIAITNDITVQHWIVDTDGTKSITTTGSKNSAGNKNYLENDVTAALNTVPTNAQLVTVINASSIGITVADQDGELVVTASTNSNYSVGDQLYVHWYVQKLQDSGTNWHVDGSLRVKDKVTITYDGNPNSEASGVPVSYQTARGTQINIGSSESPNGTVPTTTRTGYVFEGWNTKSDGTGTTYQNNDKFTLNENTTLYAMWSKGNNRLTVNKKDESGNVLSGATFTLEEKDGSAWTQVSSGTTSSAGTYVYNNVRSQTIYRLTETYAPNGFETRNSFCFEVTTGTNQEILNIFVVDENGNTVDTPSWLQTSYTQASVSGGSGSISMNITDEAIKRNVVFVKTAADGTTKLSGAKFSLTKDSTAVTGVLADQSGADGVFSVDNATLPYGTYTLTETTAPTGYETNDPITITLNDPSGDAANRDGTYTEGTGMTFSGEDSDNASVSMTRSTSTENNIATTTYTYTVTIKDDPYKDLTIRKVAHVDNNEGDYTRNPKLTGAIFTLSRRNVSGSYESVTDITGITNGKFTISSTDGIDLKGLSAGTYKLTEISAPDGYIVLTNDIYFAIGKTGNIDFCNQNGEELAEGQEIDAGIDIDTDEDRNVTKTTLIIANTPGTALPNTGGPGTSHFTLVGLALILASAVMYGFILWRKKQE